jgi:hypothetical protein
MLRLFRRLTLTFSYGHMKLALSLTRLPYHLDQDFSGLCGIAHLPQERNARPMHTILGSQANLEAEAIDRGQVISASCASIPANRLASRMSESL